MSELAPSRYFPPVELSGPEGLLCVGGQLTPDWLLDAYLHGIFPWPVFDDEMLLAWWSPDPRAIFELDQFYASRRLRRTARSGKFSSDRAIGEYCREIWRVPPVRIALE